MFNQQRVLESFPCCLPHDLLKVFALAVMTPTLSAACWGTSGVNPMSF